MIAGKDALCTSPCACPGFPSRGWHWSGIRLAPYRTPTPRNGSQITNPMSWFSLTRISLRSQITGRRERWLNSADLRWGKWEPWEEICGPRVNRMDHLWSLAPLEVYPWLPLLCPIRYGQGCGQGWQWALKAPPTTIRECLVWHFAQPIW